MEELIKNAVAQLGIDETATRNATGSLFGLIKEGIGDDFSQIADKLPGVDDLISQASGRPPMRREAVFWEELPRRPRQCLAARPVKASSWSVFSKSWVCRPTKSGRW